MANDIVTERMTLLEVWALNAPAVSVKAEETTVHTGGNIVLTAEVSHDLDSVTYTYAWYKDGALLEGETASTLTVTETGGYTARVTASDGTMVSAETESGEVICTVEGHVFGGDWMSDDTNHWHECICGEKNDLTAHVEDKGAVTIPATETEDGVRTYSCTVCGKVLRTEEIPAAGKEHVHN